MRLPEQFIDQVQKATDIVEVIQSYTPLKRAGVNFKAPCPFHSEKTPSFVVSPAKQIFHCFGCGVGGNVFHFVMNIEKLSFFEVVKEMADKSGIPMPEMKTYQPDSFQKTYFEMYQFANSFYRNQLLKAKEVLDYLTNRGIEKKSIQEFQLGFAPSSWNALMEQAQKKGFTIKQLERAGLIVQSRGRWHDRFVNRLMFPIFDVKGRVIAFGGRVVGEGNPKYLNSPETDYFKKGTLLYGLHTAKAEIVKLKQVLVLEGYVDVIGLTQAGFLHGVATLGTALTMDHVRSLTRFAEEIIISYDGDKAGEAASLRGIDLFVQSGASVRILVLPDGFDPDDFVLKKGAKAFEQLVQEAPFYLDYKLDRLCEQFDSTSPYGQRDIAQAMIASLGKMEDEILRNAWIGKCARRLKISEVVLGKLLRKVSQTPQAPKAEPLQPVKLCQPDLLSIESEFLRYLLEEPSLAEAAFNAVSSQDFEQPMIRDFVGTIQNRWKEGSWKEADVLVLGEQDPEKISFLTALIAKPLENKNASKRFERVIGQFRRKGLEREIRKLKHELTQSEQANKEVNSILQQISQKKKALEHF